MPPPFSNPVSAASDVLRIRLAYLLPICLVATLGGLLFGYDTGVISGAIEPLTARFDLGDFLKGWMSGCVLVGCAAGVLLVGPVSDRFGRRPAMFLAAAMFLASGIGAALSNAVWVFVFFRVLGGVGIGIASISTPMYIAEITPARFRGRMVAVNQIAIVAGIALTSFINYFIAKAGDQSWLIQDGWRWMFGLGVVPAVLFAVLLIRIPESPRWLIERGDDDKAGRILEKVGGAEFARAEFAAIKASVSQEKGTWGELFSAKLRLPLVIGVLLAVLQQFIINGAGVLFTLIAIASVDKWGRKPLMHIGAIGMGISLVAMGVMAQTLTDPAGASRWMLFFILLYIACFGLSVGPVTWVILAEIFPTAVRGRALGLATFFLWTADYAVTQTFPMMDAKVSWFVAHFRHAFPFYTYAVFCVVLVLVVWRFVPETKNRSLEEIERGWGKMAKSPQS